MANHASAKKRVRRNDRRAIVNKARVSRMRTFIKKVEQAIASGGYDDAYKAFSVAQPEIQRSVAKGVIHKTTAARKLSRLSSRVKALKKA